MNQLQVFSSKEFGEVRTTTINGEAYLMLNDACRVLDIANPRNVKTRLNPDGVCTMDTIDNLGRTQQATFIDESNFYKVVFQSRKPQAEEFTEYVTSEILPAIRKTGSYTVKPMSVNEMLLLQAQSNIEMESRIEKLEVATKSMEQKVEKALENKSVDLKASLQKDITMISSLTGKAVVNVYGTLYGELEKQTGCKLDVRLDNLKQRMKQAGCMYKEVRDVPKLDAVLASKSLTKAFQTIVKEALSRHCYEYITRGQI